MPFEFDAAKYSRASQHQREWGERLIAELALTGAERVLDLGCGDGAITALLAEAVPRGLVVGIDSSAAMIDAARKRAGANLRFLHMDVNDLELDARFDVAFSNAALHWVGNHDALLLRVHRLLGDGGIARFNFAGEGNCQHFFQVVRDVMALPEFREAFENFTWPYYMPAVAQYRALVQASPFRETRVWEENADRYFPDADAMIGWIDQPSIVPFLAHLADKIRRPFRNAVVERTVTLSRCDDGTCFETFRRVNLFARK